MELLKGVPVKSFLLRGLVVAGLSTPIHAAPLPVPLPVAPSTLPAQCLWLPVWAAVPYYAPGPYLPQAASTPTPDFPAPPTGPNWFAPVPGWQALTTPPASAAPNTNWPLGPCPTSPVPVYWLPPY